MPHPLTTRFHRGILPHWEVERGRYFVTVRLADSLPRETVLRLQEIHRAVSAIKPQSPQFVTLQRRYFLTLEKYLDASSGSCALRDPNLAQFIVDEFHSLTDWQIEVPHYTIMPNHWHALIVPSPDCTHSLAAIMKRLKGRSALRIRRALGGTGSLWQREWFDRWMRDDAEFEKTIRYIQSNPVKAGLVTDWPNHPWTK